jgi:hypothetical protein
MFFQISNSKLDNFPVNYRHNNLVVNLDDGWHIAYDEHNNTLFYKGYLDKGKIKDYILEISNQEEPLYTGNFCLLKCFNQGVTVKTDRYRSFPIYYDSSLTNLHATGDKIHTDSYVMIKNNLEKVESKFKLIELKNFQNLSFDSCVDKIDNILQNKLTAFFESNSLPLHIFLSGGIDTTTLYSYVLKLKIPHVLINCLHTDLDYFYLKNHYTLSNNWGFNQIHHWSTPCVLISGAPGDEFTVRSPTTANMLLKYYNTGIDKLLENYKDSLHYFYFLKYLDIFKSQSHLHYNSLSDAIFDCSNMLVNDYQHWHMGQTIVYTPFRDMEIFETIACLRRNDLIEQVFGSVIQRELIKRNNPQLLHTISNKKNTGNYMENLTNLNIVQLPDSNL